jgi:hypothetical protein
MFSDLALWRRFAAEVPGTLDERPDYRIDPKIVSKNNSRKSAKNLYQILAKRKPDLNQILTNLRKDLDEDLSELSGCSDELFFELIALGHPVDQRISKFSAEYYQRRYPDAARDGLGAFWHYIRLGHGKKKPHLLADIKDAIWQIGTPQAVLQKYMLLVQDGPMSQEMLALSQAIGVKARSEDYGIIHVSDRGRILPESLLCPGDIVCAADLLSLEFRLKDILPSAQIVCAVDMTLQRPGLYSFAKKRGFPVLKLVAFGPTLPKYLESTRSIMARGGKLMMPTPDLVQVWSEWMDDQLVLSPEIDSRDFYVPAHDHWIDRDAPEGRDHFENFMRHSFGPGWNTRKLILCAGELGWESGFDMACMLAEMLQKRGLAVNLLWIRTPPADSARRALPQSLRPHVRSIPSNMAVWHRPSALPKALANCAAFLALDRAPVDQSPAVAAIAQGKPVACFESSINLGRIAKHFFSGHRFQQGELGDLDGLVGFVQDTTPAHSVAPQNLPSDLATFAESALSAALTASTHAAPPLPQELSEPSIIWRDWAEVADNLATSVNWVHRRMHLAAPNVQHVDLESAPYCIHHHVHFDDGLDEGFQTYAEAYRRAKQVVITVTTSEMRDRVAAAAKAIGHARLAVVENCGRDILPFLRELADEFRASPDMWWCHIHQKRSAHAKDGAKWRNSLLMALLGQPKNAMPSSGVSLADSAVGLISPTDAHARHWRGSAHLRHLVKDGFPQPLPAQPLLFPVGNMFFCRARVATAMLDLFGPDYPWPEEPIAMDGTEYHLIERLWPAVAAKLGLESRFFGFTTQVD